MKISMTSEKIKESSDLMILPHLQYIFYYINKNLGTVPCKRTKGVFKMTTISKNRISALVLILATMTSLVSGFVAPSRVAFNKNHLMTYSGVSSSSTLNMIFGKMFEEEGPLGKGITVGKVQVALSTTDRSSSTSIFRILEQASRSGGDSPQALSRLANNVCLALLRKKDDWVGACSESKWFSGNDEGKAESCFNDYANREAAKFEKVGFILRYIQYIVFKIDDEL